MKQKSLVAFIVVQLTFFPLFSNLSAYAAENDFQLGPIYIIEFMANPEEGSEWVTLRNDGEATVSLQNWLIDDIEGGSSPYTIVEQIDLEPTETVRFEIGTKLNNGGDEVRLINGEGVIQSVITYEIAEKGISWLWETEPNQNDNGSVDEGDDEAQEEENDNEGNNTEENGSDTDQEDEDQANEFVINVMFPKQVITYKPFIVGVEVTGFDPTHDYHVKLLGGEEDSQLRDVRTFSDEEWLAWNGSWSELPKLELGQSGKMFAKVKGIIQKEVAYSSMELTVRVHDITSGKSWDAEATVVPIKVGKPTVGEQPASKESTKPAQQQVSKPTVITRLVDLEKLEKSTLVSVEGTILSSINKLGAKVFYLEDETRGVKVVAKELWSGLKIGKKVRLHAEVSEAYGELYLKLDNKSDFKILGNGDISTPTKVQTGSLSENLEGKHVWVYGTVSATSGNTFYLNDGSGDAKVYIKPETGIDKPYMRTGYYSQIGGIVSQYKDEYRLLPRVQSDVAVSKTPITNSSVLGAVTELPQTGVGFAWLSLFGALVQIMLGIGLHALLRFYLKR